MATNDKMLKMINALNDKTSSGELQWEDTVQNNNYIAAMANYAVHVSCETKIDDYDNEIKEYVITIINERGKVVDQVSSFDVSGDYESKMEQLYKNARRNAMEAEKVIDDILVELNSLEA